MSDKLKENIIIPPPPPYVREPDSQSFQMQPPVVQAYPYFQPQTYTVSLPITDVSKHSHSTFTRCPACNSLGLSRTEKLFSISQVLLAILCICTGYLVIVGILILIFGMDYEHFCAKCNCRIGRKKTFCW